MYIDVYFSICRCVYVCTYIFSLTITKFAIRLAWAKTWVDARVVRVRQNGSAMIRLGSTLPINSQDFMGFFKNIVYQGRLFT